ncbi:MAG: helix-hairpin-helix domain-containing protein [Chloroflexaceae bacterium]|nr:helix-hairpin-helix domain-containing protein [Chloroflexaceae bacterium]
MSNSQPGAAGGDQAFGRFDDFTRINGVTRTTAKALYDAGIHTFAQLAAMDADTIAALVGGKPERIRGQDWVGQALELAAQQPGPEPGGLEPDALEDELNDRLTSQRRENFLLELTLDADDIPRQTSIKHVQPRARKPVGDKWGGWDTHRLISFIVTQGRIKLPTALIDLAGVESGRIADAVVQAIQDRLAQEPLAVRLTQDTAPEWLRQTNAENRAALLAEVSERLERQQAELARALGEELARRLEAQAPTLQEQLGEALARQLAALPPPAPAEVPPEAIQAPVVALLAEVSERLQGQQAELARALGEELARRLEAQVPTLQEQLGEALVRQFAVQPRPGLRPAEPTMPISETAPPAESNLQLQVLEVTLGETPHTPEQQPSWSSRLFAEVTFQLSGPAETLLEIQQSPCTLQAIASETTTGESSLLAATSHPLQPLEPPAPHPQLPGIFIMRSVGRLTFGLPRLGRHQLLVSVYLPRANLVATGLSEAFSVVP